MRATRAPSPLVQAVSDTAILWALLLGAIALQIVHAAGLALPLLARTTVWRLAQPGWPVAAIAAAVVVVTAVLAASARRPERGYFVAGVLAGLAVSFYVVFDPGTGAAFAATAIGLYRRLRKISPLA